MKTKTFTTLIVATLLLFSCGGGNNRQQQATSDTPQPVFRGFSESRVADEQSTTCNERQVAETDNPRATNVERAVRNTQQEVSNDSIFQFADIAPEFRGGHQEMRRFLEARGFPADDTNGRVIMSNFVVEKDGSLTDIRLSGAIMEVLPGGRTARIVERVEISQSVKEDVTRIIQSMPKWTPAEINGSPVRVRWALPIPFHLE